jgi:hypothetical protein
MPDKMIAYIVGIFLTGCGTATFATGVYFLKEALK